MAIATFDGNSISELSFRKRGGARTLETVPGISARGAGTNICDFRYSDEDSRTWSAHWRWAVGDEGVSEVGPCGFSLHRIRTETMGMSKAMTRGIRDGFGYCAAQTRRVCRSPGGDLAEPTG